MCPHGRFDRNVEITHLDVPIRAVSSLSLYLSRLERGFGGLFLNLLRRRTSRSAGAASPRAAPRRRPPKRLKLLLSHLRTPERAKSNPRPPEARVVRDEEVDPRQPDQGCELTHGRLYAGQDARLPRPFRVPSSLVTRPWQNVSPAVSPT